MGRCFRTLSCSPQQTISYVCWCECGCGVLPEAALFVAQFDLGPGEVVAGVGRGLPKLCSSRFEECARAQCTGLPHRLIDCVVLMRWRQCSSIVVVTGIAIHVMCACVHISIWVRL